MRQSFVHGAPIGPPPLLRLFTAQCMALLPIVLGLLLVSRPMAYSALLGGLIFIGPQHYFACWAFRFSGARAAKRVVYAFYWGEAGKFLLTVMLFAMVFVVFSRIHVVALLSTYLAMVGLHWMLTHRIVEKL